jgi:hypothetical protein
MGKGTLFVPSVETPKGLALSGRGQGHDFCARRPRVASPPILPEGAEQSFSIPRVPFVVGNSVRVQQLPEIRLEADQAVVGFLLYNLRRVAKAIAAWGNTYFALSGLAPKWGESEPRPLAGFLISSLWG